MGGHPGAVHRRCGGIDLVAVLINEPAQADMTLPDCAEFYIDTNRGRWRKAARLGAKRAKSRQRRVHVNCRADCGIKPTDRVAGTGQPVIYRQDGRYELNNLSTLVPTRVNGCPISEQNVGDGKTFQIGYTSLICRKERH